MDSPPKNETFMIIHVIPNLYDFLSSKHKLCLRQSKINVTDLDIKSDHIWHVEFWEQCIPETVPVPQQKAVRLWGEEKCTGETLQGCWNRAKVKCRNTNRSSLHIQTLWPDLAGLNISATVPVHMRLTNTPLSSPSSEWVIVAFTEQGTFEKNIVLINSASILFCILINVPHNAKLRMFLP